MKHAPLSFIFAGARFINARAGTWAGEIPNAYGYVVVEGGQTRLVIVGRLSEDPSGEHLSSCQYIEYTNTACETVFVVEYGHSDDSLVQAESSSVAQYLAKDLLNDTTIA